MCGRDIVLTQLSAMKTVDYILKFIVHDTNRALPVRYKRQKLGRGSSKACALCGGKLKALVIDSKKL